MNEAQKKQAQQAIEGWQSVRNDDPMKPAGDVLAALLQELVDAHEPSTNGMPILVSAEYSRAEVEYSMVWIANNPALFDKSFNEFAAKCKAGGWHMTSMSRDGFISIIGSPEHGPTPMA